MTKPTSSWVLATHNPGKLAELAQLLAHADIKLRPAGELGVDAPEETGDTFEQGQEFGTLESVKAVSELYMPVGGEVVSVNAALEDAPELVNNAPYADGWMVEVKPGNPAEVDSLMDKAAYLEMLKGLE